MTIEETESTRAGAIGSKGRRRFIGATAVGAVGLWAAPQVMSTANAQAACSAAPLALSLSTTTSCGDVLSSDGQASGRTEVTSTLDIEGCTSCAAGPVDTYITVRDGLGNVVVPRTAVDSVESTGGCTVVPFPADAFGVGSGHTYQGEAVYRDHPAVSASIFWTLVDLC